MGLFDQFPYTNFHDLNLNWIISQIKSIKDAAKSTAEDAVSASESAASAAASAGSAGDAAELVSQVRDDLDTVNTEMTNFIQAHSGLFNETVLWTGTASATGDTITLSDDIRNYNYIDVQATYKGAVSSSNLGTFQSNVVRFTPAMFTDDNAVLNIPYAYNDQLQICTVFMFWDSIDPTDYTKISLGYTRRVSINDQGDLTSAADPGTVIVKIVGVKNIADAEVVDARVGEDDTIYPTLKHRLDGEYSELKSAIAQGGGFNAEVKQALMNCFNYVAWKGDDPTGQTYIDALHTAMYPPANLSSISAVYTQSSTVHSDDNLDVLRDDLVVTAHYDNDTSEIVTSYTLSGTLEVGTSTITVSYGGKTATFDVSVSSPGGYLYVLQSPFESTGNNRIDTGVMYAKNSVYTILTEFVKSTNSSTVKFVYSNKKAGNDTNYIGLQTQNATLWGMGISYSNGANLGRPEATIRTAVVVTISSEGFPSATIKYKDVTNNTNRNYSTNYSADITDSANSNSIVLGDADEAGTGFTGTINDFQLIDHELTSAEISAYLANGATA